MTTRPSYLSLDRADVTALRDMVPARASDLPRQQHALMSGWGGPPQAHSCYFTASYSGGPTTVTTTIGYAVPPGVTGIDVEALMFGAGTVQLTTAADTTGTLFRAVDEQGTSPMESAYWLRTNGVLDAANGSESRRALGVLAAAVWEWTSISITVTTISGSQAGDDVYCFGLVFAPIHVPR